MQHLDGDGSAVAHVAREPDCRHPAAPELALERVRLAQRLAQHPLRSFRLHRCLHGLVEPRTYGGPE